MFGLKCLLFFVIHFRHLFAVADLSNEEPKKMANIDAFAENISKLISLSGTGYAKFKHLQKIFPSLDSLTVAQNLSSFFKAENKQDLVIAAQRLRDIYIKLEIEPSTDSMNSSQPTQSMEEKTRRCMHNWNGYVTVSFKKVQLEVGNALSKNLTNLNNLTCSRTTTKESLFMIASYFHGIGYASYKCIQEYGRRAVDHIYALFYDYAFSLTFYQAICSAGLDFQHETPMVRAHRWYTEEMKKYFIDIDSQISDTVAELLPTESTTDSTFASISASPTSNYFNSTVSNNSTDASTNTSKNNSEEVERSSMPSEGHILIQKSFVQISLIFFPSVALSLSII